MSQAIDITAKLMATENLTVVKGAVKTASFDIVSRQLTLPILKGITPVIEDMFVCHEVGHALYTSMDMLEASANNRILHGYINVIEDVRIEKLMKRKFPGIKKTMLEGYNQLNDMDFFDLAEVPDVNDLTLIDRINLWFKVGFSSGITFTDQEKQFVVRAEKTETPEEVIQLAKDILKFSKEQKQEEKQEKLEVEIPDSESEPQDGEAESDDTQESTSESESDETESDPESQETESSSSETESSNGSSESDNDEADITDDSLESITDKAMNKKFQDFVDTSVDIIYNTLDTNFVSNFIVPFKTILSDMPDNTYMLNSYGYYDEFMKKMVNEVYSEFKTTTSRSVGYLAKEFEMKKAASQYKRAQVAKSGSLDMKKIWGYQINDDLFKRTMITKDGKKHGMVILLDWSGSMSGVIEDALQQVMTLAMFCNKIQIPYQVFAFTNGYKDNKELHEKRTAHVSSTNMYDNAISNCRLLELFSDKMNNKEFNDMAKYLTNVNNFIRAEGNSLNGTPLTEAMSYMVDYIGKFIRQNNVEKTSFITLTDGQGSELRTRNTIFNWRNNYTYLTIDPKTKITYNMGKTCQTQIEAMLKMIKDRYNTTNIGFYITPNTCWKNICSAMYVNDILNWNYDEVKKSMNQDGFASFKTEGRDEMLIIPSKSLKIEEVDYEVTGKQSSSAIASRFTKAMEKRQMNRPLLNKFIQTIA